MSVSLTNILAGAFATLAATVPNAVRAVTFEKTGAQTYNPITGTMANTSVLFPGVSAIFTQYTRKDKESDFLNSRRQSIEFGDVKCFIPYSSLPVEVGMEDVIVDGATRWRIVDYAIDPTGTALHTFQLRKS